MNLQEGGIRVRENAKLDIPLVSIVTVTFNADKYLKECIQSVRRQPFKRIEHIIIDANSTDKTISILKEFENQIDYWRSEPDEGIYDAMNKAITYARGRWVYFLGADDRLLDGFAQLATKLENENTIYYGDMSYDGKVTSRKKYSAYRLSKETICHQAIIYPKKVFNYYIYNLNYPLVADWVLNLQLWGDKRFKFKFFPYVIADFSMAGASTTNKDLNFFRDRPGLIKKHLGLAIYLRFLLKQLKTSIYHFRD